MHAQLTDNGLTLELGVHVQHRVVVECNQDNDLVLTPDLLIVVRSAMVITLKRNPVIPTKHAQLMDSGVNLVIGADVQNDVVVDHNRE
jgi:hypothetical protein